MPFSIDASATPAPLRFFSFFFFFFADFHSISMLDYFHSHAISIIAISLTPRFRHTMPFHAATLILIFFS
jgi:hypothetical protein